MNKHVPLIVLILILIVMTSTSAFSQNDVQGTSPADENNNEVMMGGYLLLRLRCASGGFTLVQRVDAVQKRVIDLISNGEPQLPEVKVVTVGDSASLYAGDMLIITATPCDAKANGTTPEKLATVWGERLKTIYPRAIPLVPDSNRQTH